MKKSVILFSMLLAWTAPSAMAQTYPFSEFVHNAGLHKGYALACGLDQTAIANYEGAVSRYAVSHWPEKFHREFQTTYKRAVNKAANDRKRQLDGDFCRGVLTTLRFGADNPDSPYAHEFLAKHDKAAAWVADMKRRQDQHVAEQRRKNADQANAQRKQIVSIGSRICRQDAGTRRDIVGTSFGQPLYGRAVNDTFYITGFTEAVNGDKIKILVNAIQISSTGQYIEALPPNYTKGLHVWQDFASWRPC